MSIATEASVIFVNDRPRSLAASPTLSALVCELGLAERKGVAIALNGVVVPRIEWPVRALAAADRVLVIQATQGG
ncbi:MAG TPA: sulfur carrier protein ThiS [Opitutaceae bacterium]|jgi:sulfur carrier protein|nr:sulfur carrier protein ThiS [Opitutaceae bacterium]